MLFIQAWWRGCRRCTSSKNLQGGMCREKLTVNNLAVFGTISDYSFMVHGYCLPRKDS